MLDYLLKSGVCLAAFYLFYKLLLEKEPIHIFKRIYLLGGLLLAFSIPLITFTTTVQVAPVELSPITYSEITFEPALIEETEAEVKNFWPLILWTVYGFGVVLFGLKFLFNLFQIGSKIRKNPNQKAKGFTHVLLQHVITPHTFFSYIFLNKHQYEERKIPQEVFWHEETHAKQKHSLDVVVIELLQVVFWFNPLLYFIKKDIKLNHEFLADSAVLNKGVSLTAYQEILLAFSINSTEPVLANALNYSSIKKRFTIMKTKTSQKTTWIKSLILLPLVAVLVYSFSEKKIVEVEAQNSLIQSNLEEVNKLKVNYSTTQDTKVPDIEININHNKEILINGKNYATIKTLKKQIEKIIKDYTPDQISKLKTIIEADATIKMGFIIDIEIQLRDAGIKKRELKYYDVNTEIHKNQRKATPAQINEYNALAKEYNKQPEYRRVVKMKDYNRMEYIFNKMTVKQKQYAETFPNFPPPPPLSSNISVGLTTQRSKDSLSIPLSNKWRVGYGVNSIIKSERKYLTGRQPIKKSKDSLSIPMSDSLEFANKTYDSYEYKNRVRVGRKAFYVNDSLTPTSTSLSRKQNLKQDALENYISKNNKYEKTRNEEPHYKDRSLSEQKELDNSFSELNNLYNSLSRENQQKTKRPIYPLMPYIKIMKDGKKYYKKES
ncbi:hypothetical protein FF125_18765 [Aureibaculum algae]|uniref:Peptidase M56 domain-containing protein n=1 Tax=Aureibaculum algae TaxID=2584122 RepID=A0A5B7TYX7_9FLAO|nr:M56 family metallopeptidase [Aureibaculum algae]QCX40386.1 hypothetical protein FF125_18765 [Aureibaculum algae]